MEREYKDSGIEWIGRIPKEWEVKKLKFIVDSLSKGNGITKEEVFADGDTPCVRYGEIYTKYNHSFNYCVSATNIAIQKSPHYINHGDILCAGTGESVEEIGKNVVYLGETSCLAGGDIIVIRHHQNPSFLSYALNSNYAQAQKSKGKAKLKVVHISAFEIGSILLLLPPLPEQQRIASYLDKKCGEIDGLIELQEQMIAQLTDYKQSVITEAVTKGLNPDAELVPSGIDWIGDVPKGWEVSKAKYFVAINNGSDPQLEGDVPVYGSGATSFKTCGEFKDGPAVLIGRKGATLHIPHYIEGKYWNVDTAFDVKSKGKMELRYYYYLAICFDYKYYISQTTLPGMAQSSYYNMKLPIPPLSEQQAIASYLDTKCSEIDTLIALKQQKIETLKSYKKSVIFEAVTGKTTIA